MTKHNGPLAKHHETARMFPHRAHGVPTPQPEELPIREASNPSYDEMTEPGYFAWHSSDADSGPDVGMSLGLGGGRMLWVGEVSNARYESGGTDVAALGSSGGWWLMIYGKGPDRAMPLAKFANVEAATDFMDAMSATMKARSPDRGIGWEETRG